MARRSRTSAPASQTETPTEAAAKRARVSQTDVPAYSLDEALRVARAIAENHAFKPTRPLDVAAAMNCSPTSSVFKMLTGAAIAYGMTEGGYNAAQITPLPLARRILEPTQEGDDIEARREAIMKPRLVREFLRKYDGHKLPREDIAINVLVQMGVPRQAAQRTLKLILASANSVGILQNIKDGTYVNLRAAIPVDDSLDVDEEDWNTDKEVPELETIRTTGAPVRVLKNEGRIVSNRVFITHGKNKGLVEPIKKLLAFGELRPIVSVENPSVSQPVPDKVMGDMRSCSAAIIHVDAEQRLLDQDSNEQIVLNPNVLIEIGAAMALFGRRFILLVREGVKLPSNLQGLFEVRYSGDTLDGEATIQLLQAIADMKNHPLPEFGGMPEAR